MKVETHNILIDKAKTRRDGVYSYHGFLYLVKNNDFVAYADGCGYCFSIHGMFHQPMGRVERSKRKIGLINLLNKL